MKYVFDTNAVIALLKGEERVHARVDALPVGDVGLPLLVVGELLYGAQRSARPAENLAAVATLRGAFPVLAVTESIVERYAAVRAALVSRGRIKGDFDLVIACTAIEHGAVLVTNDGALKDGTIEGLLVEDWLV